MRWFFLENNAGYARGLVQGSMMAGILMIAFGLLILAFPQILVALIATFFIAIGIMVVGFAWKSRL